MLTFLRKIRKSLIGSSPADKSVEVSTKSEASTKSGGSTRKYILYAIGEIALVVIGILIALQINNWNETKKEREIERQYMSGLLIDLKKDKITLENNVEFGPIPVMYNDSLFSELQMKPLKGRETRIYHFLLLFTNGIDISYHDRTISQLKNSGGFGLIKNQHISDAILDYDIFMRESIRFNESSRSNHIINNDILHNQKMYELYKVGHLKKKAIAFKDDLNKVGYPNDLKLITYNDQDIKIALNSMSSVRSVDEVNYKRAVQAFDMNKALDSLIRVEYSCN